MLTATLRFGNLCNGARGVVEGFDPTRSHCPIVRFRGLGGKGEKKKLLLAERMKVELDALWIRCCLRWKTKGGVWRRDVSFHSLSLGQSQCTRVRW